MFIKYNIYLKTLYKYNFSLHLKQKNFHYQGKVHIIIYKLRLCTCITVKKFFIIMFFLHLKNKLYYLLFHKKMKKLVNLI